MTFDMVKNEAVRCSGIGIRRPCWNDKTLRITGDKQFAGARVVQKGRENETIAEMAKDIQHKRETIYDGSDLFYQTDNGEYSDGGVYNGKPLKLGFAGEGLPYGKKDYLAKDWEIYADAKVPVNIFDSGEKPAKEGKNMNGFHYDEASRKITITEPNWIVTWENVEKDIAEEAGKMYRASKSIDSFLHQKGCKRSWANTGGSK